MSRPGWILKLMVYGAIFYIGFTPPVGAAAPGVPVFVIGDAVTVNGPDIHLGDLGTLRNGTARDLENLRLINLGAAPLPGQTRKLSRSYLELILRQHQVTQNMVLEMGDQVEIRVAAVCIEARDLQAAVEKMIPAKKPQFIKEWLELRNLPEAIWLSNKEWRIEATPVGGVPEFGSVLFKVTLSSGNERRVLNLGGRIRVTALVFKARRDLPRFAELDPGDFEAVESELSNGAELLGTIPSGMRTTKPFHRGEILRSDWIQKVPLVHKGQEVGVIVKSDRLEIRIIGIARSDGWLGDWIQLQNPSSRKFFRGRVIGKDLVEVVPK